MSDKSIEQKIVEGLQEFSDELKYSIGSTFHTKEATLEIVNRMRRKTGEPLYFVSFNGKEAKPMSQQELDLWLSKYGIVSW